MSIIKQKDKLTELRQELQNELSEILAYWAIHTIDDKHGGFAGGISNSNEWDNSALKGLVLNSRILWTFSAAYNQQPLPAYLNITQIAWQYISRYFIDREFGGVYWSVTRDGQPADTRKQIYGLAFCIYGLSEYYKMSKDPASLELAMQLYDAVEGHSFDNKTGGYFEAFARDWTALDDLRLSEKDDNEKKTMNTHLHIIEAYANLYTITKNDLVKQQIIHLLQVFDEHIINKKNGHLNLFMDEDWQVKSSLISYGHDIEAAWLLQECAEIINEPFYVDQFKKWAIVLANAAAEGLDRDGALWYEYEPASDHLIKEKHWWPQTEAMVGFFNAWQLSGKEKYLDYVFNNWQFIQDHLKDKKKGEWFWGVNEDYSIIQKEKAGFWKCPYHNGRACIELIKRISTVIE